jgi:hypothetical protein
MDDMSTFKIKAIGSMEQTVASLTTEVDKAKSYLAAQRNRGELSGDGDVGLALPASSTSV